MFGHAKTQAAEMHGRMLEAQRALQAFLTGEFECRAALEKHREAFAQAQRTISEADAVLSNLTLEPLPS